MRAYPNIPDRTLQTIKDYINHGWEPGDFVRAVLENNLALSFGRADEENREALFEIVKFVWNEIDSLCWGSPELVNAWIEHKRKVKNETIPSE